MSLQYIDSANNLEGKTVLVRVDYNVPLEKENDSWQVEDGRRIDDSLETINYLQEKNCKIILMSHLGRPGGEKNAELSLKPTAEYLQQKLQQPVAFISKTVGEEVKSVVEKLENQDVLLLENLRFNPGEKQNDQNFARQLAELADVYVNEAFSTCHREHASIAGVPQLLPAFAGFHIRKEVESLSQLIKNPEHPFVMVIGGAKISDKVEAVKNLDQVADLVLVGGGVANNFLKAGGIETHKSYLEDQPADQDKEGTDYVKVAGDLLEESKTEKVLKDGYIPLPKILYPTDVVAAKDKESDQIQIIDLTHDMKDTPDDEDLMYLDIGPRTIKLYQEMILQAKTVFWNGPMGVFEKEQFSQGTKEIARAAAKSSARTILGGGDTIAAIKEFGFSGRYDYVSSAGGASLDFLSGKKLPGLEAVKAK